MRISPYYVIKYFHLWPPFLASGIRVCEFDLDAGFIRSQLRTSFLNSNYFGTHFGGSLFSMCDPFYVFLLVHKLGKDYYIWDLRASIEFKKATSQPVFADFYVTEKNIQDIRAQAEHGERVEPCFSLDIKQADGLVIASVAKTMYVKKKRRSKL